MGDPKMDSGCVKDEDDFEDDFDVTRDLSPEELIWLIDELTCREVWVRFQVEHNTHHENRLHGIKAIPSHRQSSRQSTSTESCGRIQSIYSMPISSETLSVDPVRHYRKSFAPTASAWSNAVIWFWPWLLENITTK